MKGNLSKCRLEVKDFDTSCVGHLGAVRRFGEIVPPNRLGSAIRRSNQCKLSVVYRKVSVFLFNEMGSTGRVKSRSFLLPMGAMDGSLTIRTLRLSRC